VLCGAFCWSLWLWCLAAASPGAKGWGVERLAARVANRNARAFLASQGREGE